MDTMRDAAAGQGTGGARRSGVSVVTAALVGVLLTAVACGAWYYLAVHRPMKVHVEERQESTVQLTGLLSPAGERNKLDEAYVDADGDLVADAPGDAAKLADPAVLRFCYVAAEDHAPYREAFADFMAHLSKVTGKKVEYVEYEATEDHLSAMKNGALDVTAFSTGSVPAAVCQAGFVPVACLGTEAGGSKYEMHIVVRPDAGIGSVPDLKGKDLALTDAGSNSGYKAPLVMIKSDFGLLPGRHFGVRYSGGQEQSIKGLADGTYQAAAVASDVLGREVAAGRVKEGQFKSIYKSESFPTAAFGYAHNLTPALAAKVREAILGFRFAGTSMERFFAGSTQDRLVPVNYKNDWSLVRRIDDAMGSAYAVK
jgi:phosphonate transport system substrate-binding protein